MIPKKLAWFIFVVSVAVASLGGQSAHAEETTVLTLMNGRGVDGIEIEIINALSGMSIKTGQSNHGRGVQFDDLDEGRLYIAQTVDGEIFSDSFSAGSTIELELGRVGWNVATSVGFAVGSSSATFESDAGLDADESGVGGGPDVGVILFAPPRRVVIDGVRPFLETRIQIPVLDPVEFEGDGGGVAEVTEELRFSLGAGAAFPFDLASRTMTLEPSVRYALTKFELSSRPSGFNEHTKTATSHAVQLGLVLDVPVGKIGPIGIGLDLGVLGHFPISGKATVNSDLNAEPQIGVQAMIGIRGTYEGLLRGR